MTAILGLSAFYHDSAAALVVDGSIIAAAQEERFSRVKHDARFPASAVAYCLQEAGIGPGDLDYVVFYEKPLLKFDRLLETYFAGGVTGFRSFRRAIPGWLRWKLNLRRTLRRLLPGVNAPLLFTSHHESHAASAFFPSPFDSAAILTLDGVGEWTTAARGSGAGNKIQLTREVRFPHSLGLLYSAFTHYCGFRVNSGEYKLMGLAPYGVPAYREAILKHLIDLRPDGSFWLDQSYFDYCGGLTMTGRRFHRLFGGAPRDPESPLTQKHMDLAASVQAVTEEAMLLAARDLHRETGLSNLVMAGGVALNCVANARLLREGPFEHLWVQPAAGDAGGALGAALFVWYQLLGRARVPDPADAMQGARLGPAFTTPEIEKALDANGLPYRFVPDTDLFDHVAERLTAGQAVGWFAGRMEFGPRALGGRSILADPRNPDTQARLNLRTKFRESFRPFAPAVLSSRAADWFDLPRAQESPYMLLVAPVRPDRRVALSGRQIETMQRDPDLRVRVRIPRSTIPAVTHVDYTARVQTVDAARDQRFAQLLDTFGRWTGCPLLVNTSFNVRGEPIVCTPTDAARCFLATDLDVLVLENCVADKADIPAQRVDAARKEYQAAGHTD